MGKQANKITGNRGERLAGEYLERKGYQIIGRNYASKWGEIDLIARCQIHDLGFKREEVVVFVEVKTKTTDKYGEPWEMVNHWKIEQVKRMGEIWCREFDWQGRVRVDVVGVYLDDVVPRIEHWESVEI